MSRQVLTIPDVPVPPLLIRTTADSLYAPIGHNHDATYVNVTGDTMTGALDINAAPAVLTTKYNGSTISSRIGQVTTNGYWLSLNARYDGSAWQRDDTSKASTMFSMGQGDFAFYNQVAGANPISSWVNRFYIGPNGAATLAPDTGVRALTAPSIDMGIGDGHGIGGQWINAHSGLAPGARTVPQGGMTYFNDATYGTIQFWAHPWGYGPMFSFNNVNNGVRWIEINAYGSLILNPEQGDYHLQSKTSNLNFYSPGNITMRPAGTVFHPRDDNNVNLGYPTFRWTAVYAVNPTIQTSHVSKKRDFVYLDPVACVNAVLDTDWLSFNYIDPQVPDGEEPSESYLKMVEDTAVYRAQKGYALGSDVYKTSELFGQPDRYSASTHADLAVVACALQQALREIADLKARLV